MTDKRTLEDHIDVILILKQIIIEESKRYILSVLETSRTESLKRGGLESHYILEELNRLYKTGFEKETVEKALQALAEDEEIDYKFLTGPTTLPVRVYSAKEGVEYQIYLTEDFS